jgi:cell division protein FtsZ
MESEWGEEPIIDYKQSGILGARILVIGVGGGGCNAIRSMIQSDLKGVEFVAVNTDVQALNRIDAQRIQIGSAVSRGLGAGANPDVGRRSAIEDMDKIRSVVVGADMVFVTAGMGGGTGTGAAPVIAQVAREAGILTVAVVTTPFGFEGPKRGRNAEEGLRELRRYTDTLIVIPNDRLESVVDRGTPLIDAFKKADDVLRQGVQGISDIITRPGLINLDFADVRTTMANMGRAVMGIGIASGPDRALVAARAAINSPLLEDSSIRGAKGILVNFRGGSNMTLNEITEASRLIEEEAEKGSANLIFGTVVEDHPMEEIHITVIATGFDRPAEPDESPAVDETLATAEGQEEMPAYLRRQSLQPGRLPLREVPPAPPVSGEGEGLTERPAIWRKRGEP